MSCLKKQTRGSYRLTHGEAVVVRWESGCFSIEISSPRFKSQWWQGHNFYFYVTYICECLAVISLAKSSMSGIVATLGTVSPQPEFQKQTTVNKAYLL